MRKTQKRPSSGAASAPPTIEPAPSLPAKAPPAAPHTPEASGRAKPQGFVDHVGPSRVAGWAWDAANPDARLSVTIEVDGKEVATVVADRHRPDLAAAGKGDGAHAFEVQLPGTGPITAASLRCIVGGSDGVLGMSARARDQR